MTVSVRYAGASGEEIESEVIKPLEDSIADVDGVDVITSISRADQGQISVRFRLEKDADSAAAEVRDRTSRVRNRLPQAIEEPVISKVEADAFPVVQVGFSSESLTSLQINDLVNRIVKPRLQTVTGVADVRIFGERKYAMRVWLDSDKMASYRLTTQDVEDAIRRSNLELLAGRIESQQREFSVTSQTDLTRPVQFGAIVIKNVNVFRSSCAMWRMCRKAPVFVVPTMYTLFARKAIPAANTTVAKEGPDSAVVHPEYVAK